MKQELLKQLNKALKEAQVKEARSGLEVMNHNMRNNVIGSGDLLVMYSRDQGHVNGLKEAIEIVEGMEG